jgi:hypothetical protein
MRNITKPITKLHTIPDHQLNEIHCYIPFNVTLPEKVDFIYQTTQKYELYNLCVYMAAEPTGRLRFKELTIPWYIPINITPELLKKALIKYLDI